MRIGTVHKLINLLLEAFEQLDVHAEPRIVENAAVMVHKAMTLQARNYHTLEHVFNFIEPPDPIRTLTAMYHDLVYYQVDRGFLPEIREIIAPYILEKDGQVYLREAIPSRDRTFNINVAIFDLPTQANLSPFEGLNEFLSALVMSKQLENIVSEKDRFRISVCIEGTIPFRKPDYFEHLSERAHKVCRQYEVPLSSQEIEDSIRMSVDFANRDVESFAEDEPEKFLSATWKLLPETNEALRAREVYSILEFRRALENMETFMRNLDPEHVFHCYKNVPPAEEFQKMETRVHNNLAIAREYLQIKLLAQALLEGEGEGRGRRACSSRTPRSRRSETRHRDSSRGGRSPRRHSHGWRVLRRAPCTTCVSCSWHAKAR